MIEEKVKKILEDILKEKNMWMDSIKYEKEGNNNFLRIVVDREKSIDIDTIVEKTDFHIMPFGPALIISAFVCMFYWDKIKLIITNFIYYSLFSWLHSI